MFGHIKRELCDLEFNFKGGDKKKKLAFHVLKTILKINRF